MRFSALEILILLTIAAIIVGNIVSTKWREEERHAFMVACLKDRKEYECTAMWRAGESHEQIIPIFIPTGAR